MQAWPANKYSRLTNEKLNITDKKWLSVKGLM